MSDDRPIGNARKGRKLLYLLLMIMTGAATFGVMLLQQNIATRKREAEQVVFKVVELNENTIDPAQWGKNYPRQYDGYRRTVDTERTKHGGSEAFQKLDADPRWRVLFQGYAFGVDYREERGHAYMLSDQDMTERVKQFKQPGACLHCHASVIPAYRQAGRTAGIADATGFNWNQVLKGFELVCAMPYGEARKQVDHPVSCVDCHDPLSMQLRVTRPGFLVGIQALARSDDPVPHLPSIGRWRKGSRASAYDPNTEASRQEMRSFVCGQCHVEYYFKGEGKLLTYPWSGGLKAEQIEAYYDEVEHTDWTHATSGAKVLKAQHPEFELWSQGIHARSGVACADCHMPYQREGAIKISDHHVRSPLLNIARACQTCHRFPEEELKSRAVAIQDRTQSLLVRAEEAVVDLIRTIEASKTTALSDEQLEPARQLHRKAEWRLDFVAAENSMGFHAPQESARLLAEAIDFARQGQVEVLKAQAGKENIQLGLRLPPRFEVTEFADSKLANDVFSMTIDPRGRVIVSGRGYIRILVDDDGDGRADRAIDFADGPADGAQGMLWEGTSLFVTGDGGLRRYRDEDGDDRADGPSELIRNMKTGGEHEGHDIKRGPDGWLYVLCGNMSGINRSFAQLPTSPISDPVAGCVIRFSPDLKLSEIVADGYRNTYRMDWNADGELFTYDSDNERCVSLPWYEPTRFYHVICGGHYGWLAPQHGQFFRLPPYFPDVVAPVAYLGRGSPTGAACYRHLQFPESYRDGMFLADWTFGRIYFLPLQRSGARFVSEPRVFLESIGENGFAPTDLAVHPRTGDLFVSIGGRGTRGAVYRIRFPAGVRDFKSEDIAALQPRKPAAIGSQRQPVTEIDGTMASIRRVQLAVGGIGSPRQAGTIWEGYSPRLELSQFELAGETATHALERMRGMFPSGDADIDREVTRTLAMFEDDDPATLGRVVERVTKDSSPVEDIHYLAVLARLSGERSRELAGLTAQALLALDRKCDERGLNRDRHWPLRVAELHAELARKDTLLNERMLAEAEFGRPDHVLFALCPGFDRRRAAEIFLDRSTRDKNFAWNAALVELVTSLPESESLLILRTLWDNLGLREAIIVQLALNPKTEDRDKFLDAMNSPQLATVGVCLDALKKLLAANDTVELVTLVRAMRRLQGGKEEDRLRDRVGNFLQQQTGQSISLSDAEGWTAWLVQTHPELASRLSGPDGVDVAAWNARLECLDWSAGDADRGRAVFAQTGCVACHSGARASGPDLRGVASRFSRNDLFTAILQPSKDVSPRYQTTLVATADGKLYQGTIIYEAVDSLILQTGADTTVRIVNNQIVERRATPNSLMPAGLLDKLNDQETADIYAYLKSLR